MLQKKYLAIIVLFILVITAIRLSWINQEANNHLIAESGVIVLDENQLLDSDYVLLNGSWEFYPHQFVDHETMKASSIQQLKTIISVPSNWSGMFTDELEERKGTYRLHIDLNEQSNDERLIIQLPRRAAVNKLFMNENLLIDNEIAIANNNPNEIIRSASFYLDGKEHLDLLIQVSEPENFRDKGIVKAIKLGKESSVQYTNNVSIAMQIFVAIILLVLFFISSTLFVFRREHVEYIYLSLIALSAILATLLDDDKLLLVMFDLNYVHSVKLAFLGYIGIGMFALLFFRTILIDGKKNKMIRVLIKLSLFSSLLIMIVPISMLSYVSLAAFLLVAFSYIYLAIMLRNQVKRGDSTALFLLLAIVAIISSFIWGLYKSFHMVELPYYPYDILIAFLFYYLYVLKSILNISDENKLLSVQLQKEMEQKDEFLAKTSYELRKPLHAIIHIAETWIHDKERRLQRTEKDHVSTLVNIGYNMSQMVDDLIDFTQLREGRVTLDLKPVNVRSTILGAIDMLKMLADYKNIEINVSIANTFPNVLADKKRFIQIIYNLVHNAIKFTDGGRISIYAHVSGNIAKIYLEDKGTGIDEATLKNIFQPYEQGSDSSTREGIGLGLFISKQ